MGEGGLAGQRDFAARLRVLRRALQLFTTVMKATSSEQIVATEDRRLAPSFAEASRFWLEFGFISFGGPTAQIALLHGELVEKKRWISETRFFHALNFCMLLPGPEAHQLAIYIGWLLHKIRGGVIAGTLFVLPASIFLWSLTWAYAVYGKIAWVAAIFFGVKAAVMAIVAEAVIRIGSQVLKNDVLLSLAVLAFVAIFFLKVPFPLVVLTAGLIVLVGCKFWKDKFLVFGQNKSGTKDQEIVLSDEMESPAHTKPSLPRAIKVSAIWFTLWWAPVLLTGLWRGWNDTVFREGLFFSKAAVVTLGGPYSERLRGNAHLTTALSAITAAVVGVVMNLAVWFGMHILLPKNEPFNWFAAVVGVLVFFGMWKWKWGIIPVIIGAGILGLLYNLMRGISLI